MNAAATHGLLVDDDPLYLRTLQRTLARLKAAVLYTVRAMSIKSRHRPGTERLSATPGQLEHNLRMTIREAWERGDRALLRRLLPWCGDACPPETKDFLFGLAAWLRVGIPENVLPRSGGNGENL